MSDLTDEQRAQARERRRRIRNCGRCDELGWEELPDGTVSRCAHTHQNKD